MDYDLKIVGGTIVAGSGSAGYRGDVGIVDGKVVALGNVKGQATTTVDAGDQVVCPGFFVSRVLRVPGSSCPGFFVS
ncbi:MAG: N-acyl-D-amino-acid deacylase, partial [Gammaproteobacteria bacterium]